jgi:excisionase family DNA binding protein
VAATESWLSVDEIAKHLGISKETIYRWLERGKIPAHRVGRLWKFRASEVDKWIVNGDAGELGENEHKTRKMSSVPESS